MTSARRRAKAGRGIRQGETVRPGAVPWEITWEALEDPFWADPVAVAAFLARHRLPEPHAAYWAVPRALRDHCAWSWCLTNGYKNRWDLPNWEAARTAGITPPGGARTRARLVHGGYRVTGGTPSIV